jgi:hypothetical protein
MNATGPRKSDWAYSGVVVQTTHGSDGNRMAA